MRGIEEHESRATIHFGAGAKSPNLSTARSARVRPTVQRSLLWSLHYLASSSRTKKSLKRTNKVELSSQRTRNTLSGNVPKI